MNMGDDSAIQNDEAGFPSDSEDDYDFPSRRSDEDDASGGSELRRVDLNETVSSAREKKEAVSIWQHELDIFRRSIERENAHLLHSKSDA